MENNNDANNKVGDKSLRAIGKGIEIAGGTNYGATGTATGYSVPDTSGGDRHEAVSTRTQIELVVHSLGFTKKQLEEVLGVPRQEIYDWVKGDNVRDETSGRLLKLARLIAKIPAEQRRPLHHRFTTLPLAEGESSFLICFVQKSGTKTEFLINFAAPEN